MAMDCSLGCTEKSLWKQQDHGYTGLASIISRTTEELPKRANPIPQMLSQLAGKAFKKERMVLRPEALSPYISEWQMPKNRN
jgi:hypothetical protein